MNAIERLEKAKAKLRKLDSLVGSAVNCAENEGRFAQSADTAVRELDDLLDEMKEVVSSLEADKS